MKKFKTVLYTNKSKQINSVVNASKPASRKPVPVKVKADRNPSTHTCECGKVVKTSRYKLGTRPYKCNPCRYPKSN